MSEDQFSAAEARIDKFELGQLHTAAQWQCFFDDGIILLCHPDEKMKDYAIERMQKAIWSENSQHCRQRDFVATPASQRLTPILEAITEQKEQRERCLLRFSKWVNLSDEQSGIFSQWLEASKTASLFAADTLTTVKIQAELYPKDDWNDTRRFLEPFFSHSNDLLRAASGAALGDLYNSGADNLPPLDDMMQQIKDWEIERPGFAGAFLGQVSMNIGKDGKIERSEINLTDWILEIIAKRETDEPDVPLYNGINFHAHEILSGNPEAVRKLIDFGAESVAAMTATEESRPIAGMQPLLEELANSQDDFVSRICCWHLAYQYRCVHSEASRRGYVERAERDGVEVLLVFNPEEAANRPYAATIYPKETFLTDETAWTWIDKLNPPNLRPPMEDNDYFRTPQIRPDNAGYMYGAYCINLYGDSKNKKWDRVWVKWPLPSSKW